MPRQDFEQPPADDGTEEDQVTTPPALVSPPPSVTDEESMPFVAPVVVSAAAGAAAPRADDGEESDDDAPDIGEEERNYDDSAEEGVYTVKKITDSFAIVRWKVKNWSQQEKRTLSPTFHVGDAPWRLLLFPLGNQQIVEASVYLECPDAPTQRVGWTRYAEFRLGIVNQRDLRKSKFQEARKRFNRSEPDWGFSKFIPLAKLETNEQGYRVNDTVIIEARVEVKKDQYSGYAFHGYDCRKETGFVGLRNQGATCYMNSLLQTLYHIPEFRRSVYLMRMPEMEDNTRNIPLALQRLFWQLQFSQDSVSTKQLTKSFGWGAMESFVQHDVQELLRVLVDNLDEKMKGSELEGTMGKLFSGRMKNYIKCINVDYESKREEEFFDLQLVVKNCKNVLESFDKYVEEEVLDGDNKYEAEGFGRQDARKGVRFLSLPPLLMLQLKRFEYNFETDNMYKINDRYEFPVDMNLDHFMADEAEREVPNDYTLLSILVHSGDVSGGHYYAYIRPGLQDNWLKFDDERVTPATEKESVEDNFGGEEEPEHEKPVKNFGYPNWDVPCGHVRRFQSLFKRYANAYMLVYVRRADVGRYMRPIEVEEIPDELRQRFEQEQEQEELKKREKQEAHLYVSVKVVTDDLFKDRYGFGLVSEDDDKLPTVRVRKAAAFSEFKEEVAKVTPVPAANMRLWKFHNRHSTAYRPETVVSAADSTAVDIALTLRGHLYGPERIALFAETVPEGAAATVSGVDTLIFFKFYDPAERKLSYAGHAVMPWVTTIADMYPMVRRQIGLPEDTPLVAYEETTMNVRVREGHLTIRDGNLNNGDILIFQTQLSAEDSVPDAKYALPCVSDYFNYMVNRCTVKICKLEEPKEVAFTLDLMRNMSYAAVVAEIGKQVNHPAEKIRLTAHSTYLEAPRQTPIKTTDVRTLREMLFFANAWSDTLYYETLEDPVAEVENKKEVTLRFFNERVEEECKVRMVVPRNATIQILLMEFVKKITVRGTGLLRLIETFSGKVQKVFKPTESVEWLHEYGHIVLRVEEIGQEELPESREEGDRVVQIQHFCRDHNITTRCFGHPFFIRIGVDDTFADIKARIKAKLAIPDEEFNTWKFAVLYFQRPEYVKDEDNVLQAMKRVETYKLEAAIGMEHKDTTPRPATGTITSYRHKETPIKIYN